MKYKIYRGQKPDGSWKIGCTINYPQRCCKQKLTNYYILEEHDCKYTASNRERELQNEYGYRVDETRYYKIYDEKIKGHTQETKNKIREARKKQDMSIQIESMRKSNLGKKRDKEICKKISNSLKGKSLSLEHRMKISKANANRTRSEEFRKKVSEAVKGYVKTDEHRKNLSLSNYGKGILKEYNVLWIRAQYDRKVDMFGNKITQDRLAAVFNIQQGKISSVVNRKCWNHI